MTEQDETWMDGVIKAQNYSFNRFQTRSNLML